MLAEKINATLYYYTYYLLSIVPRNTVRRRRGRKVCSGNNCDHIDIIPHTCLNITLFIGNVQVMLMKAAPHPHMNSLPSWVLTMLAGLTIDEALPLDILG